MEKATYAKIMGLSLDENGNPDFGYFASEGQQLTKEMLMDIFSAAPNEVVMLTKEEYENETADVEDYEA